MTTVARTIISKGPVTYTGPVVEECSNGSELGLSSEKVKRNKNQKYKKEEEVDFLLRENIETRILPFLKQRRRR